MNTHEINAILNNNPITKRVYKGCFAADKIPVCKKPPCAFVVNFDEHDEPGTHWVTVFVENNVHVYYFDSLATPYESEQIETIREYLRKHFRIVTRIKSPLQSRDSQACGAYAIFFVYAFAANLSPNIIPDLLRLTGDPDRYVCHFIRKYVLNV